MMRRAALSFLRLPVLFPPAFPARGAGFAWLYRKFRPQTGAALLAVLMLHALPAGAQDRVLVPWKTIGGGQLLAAQDAAGDPLPGAQQGYVALVFPSFVAARGPDLYIADSGARRVYRYDPAMQSLVAVPGLEASSRTRLQVGLDRTLYVLDAGSPSVLHLDGAGQLLETLSDPQAEASLGEIALDERTGQIIASDRRSRRLLMIDPPAWASRVLPLGGAGAPWGALARRDGNTYAVDGKCACVIVMDEDGRVRERIGEGTLVQPHALAADRHGRLFVADAHQQILRIYRSGDLIGSYEARNLHVKEFGSLATDEETLYVADGPGGQVAIFHIRPPGTRASGKKRQ